MDSNNRILYQIKTLETMIVRNFLENSNKFLEENISKIKQKPPTPTQMQIIGYILEHENEEIYQKDLEKVLKLRRATVSGVLQTMEKNNLIKRVTYTKDSRTKKIILNEQTKKTFENNIKKINNLEKIITKNIPQKDLEIFSNVLEKMKENIEKSVIQEKI